MNCLLTYDRNVSSLNYTQGWVFGYFFFGSVAKETLKKNFHTFFTFQEYLYDDDDYDDNTCAIYYKNLLP